MSTSWKSMSTGFDPIQYKANTKTNWNTVAPDYHHNWAAQHIGPFKSTRELVNLADIKPSDKVLDLGCGTGVISKEVSMHLNNGGLLVGIDLSRTALSIAKQSIQFPNSLFLEMDAENIGLHFRFNKILCQYVLMFCPDVRRVLDSAKDNLKDDGRLVLAVHGLDYEVPYFSSIMRSIIKYIPDIRPDGTPNVHRFGNPDDLKRILVESGFSSIVIRKYVFTYEAGTFEEYWNDYMHSTANSIRPKIEKYGIEIMHKIKDESMRNVSKYIKNNNIVFPWTVLIATAAKHV